MKKLILFNHKGGVSKTTSTFHIGWMLAKKGHKVLLVDADPQCNLTSVFMGEKFDEYYENPLTLSKNIKDGVSPAFDGLGRLIEGFECPVAERNVNLFLLPGHMNLSEYDSQLTFSMSGSFSAMKSLPGSFNDLIEKVGERYGIEYALIDVNPGLSSINQIMFLISDGFIIPTNPDTFSLMAIKSLSLILPRWVDWKQSCISIYESSPYPLPDITPKFIGEIPQRFNVRNGSATKPFKEKIEELSRLITGTLVPQLTEKGMVFTDEEYARAGIQTDSYVIEEIKDFQTLLPKSTKVSVPVYELTDAELDATGAVLAQAQQNRETFKHIYERISDKILSILAC